MDKPMINVQVIQPNTRENWYSIMKYILVLAVLVGGTLLLQVPAKQQDVVGNTYRSTVARYHLTVGQADQLAQDMSRWLTANPGLVNEPYRLRRIVSEWAVHYDMVQ